MGIVEGLLIAAAVAGTAAQVNSSRQAARESKDARRDQASANRQRMAELAESQKANDATMAARSARMRQRAVLAGMNGNDATIGTSPLGLAQTQASPSGPQPLKNLGA